VVGGVYYSEIVLMALWSILLACPVGFMLALLGYTGKWLYKHAIVHDVCGHAHAWFIAEVSVGGANEHVQA
jgi:hypothetical protein